MNPPHVNPATGLTPAEETLRLVATLPPPDGLVDRVQAGLRAAPRTAQVLSWRAPQSPAGSWMHSTFARGAAAAAIVCVVAGGGWRIYSRVQTAPTAKVIVMPSPGRPSSGFSTGNAMRVPQTLDYPVIAHPVIAHPVPQSPAATASDEASPAPKAAARRPRIGKKKTPSGFTGAPER